MLQGEGSSNIGADADESTEAEVASGAESIETLIFTDSVEMLELKKRILEAGVESEEFGGLYGKYQEAGEVLADAVRGADGRVALMIKSAQLIEQLGLVDDAIEMYNDAYYSAQQEGLDTLAEQIKGMIDKL